MPTWLWIVASVVVLEWTAVILYVHYRFRRK
jgi:hypothetical protein